MTTHVLDNAAERRFEILEGDHLVGFTEYHRDRDRMHFPHTEVFDGYEGRGLASTLIRDALDRCRAAGLSVVPECSFVRSFIERHPEYQDLVAPSS